MIITLDFLRSKDADETDCLVFTTEWPDGAAITRANLHRADELELNFYWLAGAVLSPTQQAAYSDTVFKICEMHDLTVDEAYDIYGATTLAYHEAFLENDAENIRTKAHKVCDVSITEPRDTLLHALDDADKAFRIAKADALADILGLPASIARNCLTTEEV